LVRRVGAPLKACRKCKMLVPLNINMCPNCGSKDFSDDWSGMAVILREDSILAKKLGIRTPGKYALRVR